MLLLNLVIKLLRIDSNNFNDYTWLYMSFLFQNLFLFLFSLCVCVFVCFLSRPIILCVKETKQNKKKTKTKNKKTKLNKTNKNHWALNVTQI